MSGGPLRLPLDRRWLLAATALVLAVGGCDCPRGSGVHYRSMRADALLDTAQVRELPQSARKRHGLRPGLPLPPTPPAGDKVHPLVRQAILTRPLDRDTLIVSFRDTLSRALVVGVAGDDLADSMATLRSAAYAADTVGFAGAFGAAIFRTYWLVQAVLVEMPLNEVDSLATRDRVVRIEPLRAGDPPQCGTPTTDLGHVREQLKTSGFATAGYGGGKIALLDTGIMEKHILLGESGHLGQRFDCFPNGCTGVVSQNDLEPEGHGTCTAGILVAGEAKGEDHVGLTTATLDSYQIYEPTAAGAKTNLDAAEAAFEEVLTANPRYDVAVVEVAVPDSDSGILTQCANWAFDLGTLVVVANGNLGFTSVPSPAVAPRALGVGAYCIYTNAFEAAYVNMATVDQRWKPDLTGPTGAYTAAADVTSNDEMRSFGGTSGATPFAGGAALLLRNWMVHSTTTPVEPGHVYAVLLLCAENEGIDAIEGAGRVRLPEDGLVYWGSVPVVEGEKWSIPIEVPDGVSAKLTSVIWWPEYDLDGSGIPSSQSRSNIDLFLAKPDGTISSESVDIGAVCERVSGTGVSGGDWKVEVVGLHVPLGTQTVYWAAWATW